MVSAGKTPEYQPATLMGLAALVICTAFLVHNINALYIEPNFLGFRDPRVDYADLAKLKNALGSLPWRLSGFGHLLSGFACVVLGMSARNPELADAAYLSLSIVRIIFNCLAQVGLGWFAWQLSYCGLRTGMLPKAFCWFGYLSGFTGLIMGLTFIPIYLQTVLIWSGWLAFLMLRRAALPVQAA